MNNTKIIRYKLLIRLALLAASLVCMSGFLYVFFYMPYRQNIELGIKNIPVAKNVLNADTQRLLGYVSLGKTSGFSNFSVAKAPGVIRIGCFGCSFTYGDEVGPTGDYAAQLQKIYRQAGKNNVEVINFGSRLYGFTQTYLLFENIGKKYNLDYVIIGPESFFPERDRTFNNYNGNLASFLHARYIITKSGLQLLPVLGQTPLEQRYLYFRFIPVWYYCRYDAGLPAVIRSIYKQANTFNNPFYYYKGTAETETNIIYRELLSRIANTPSVKKLYVINHNASIVSLCQDMHHPKITATFFQKQTGFPYLAPNRHYSVFGNKRLAQTLYGWLKGLPVPATIAPFQLINEPPRRGITTAHLNTYKHVTLLQAGKRVAELVQYTNGYSPFSLTLPLVRDHFNKKSLLIIQQQDLLNAFWVEIDQPLTKNAEVSLAVQIGKKTTRYPLGGIHLYASSIGTFSFPSLSIKNNEWKIYIDPGQAAPGSLLNLPPQSRWAILLGNEILLSNSPRHQTVFLKPMVTSANSQLLTTAPIYIQLGKEPPIPLVRPKTDF